MNGDLGGEEGLNDPCSPLQQAVVAVLGPGEGQYDTRLPSWLSALWKTHDGSFLLQQGRLEELERELLEVNGNAERLARSFSELVELQLVLEKASAFFDDAQHRASTATFQTQPADTGSEFLSSHSLGGPVF